MLPQGVVTEVPNPTEPPTRNFPVSSVLIGVGVIVLLLVGAALLTGYTISGPSLREENHPKKIGIAFFRQGVSSVEGFKSGLEHLGYTNIGYIEVELFPSPTLGADMDLAIRELLAENVDLIFADHEWQAKTALDITAELAQDVPIVYLSRFNDPLDLGLAESYQSSGNNATGIRTDLALAAQKNLGFLSAINPSARRVGLFTGGFMVPGIGEPSVAELKRQAERLGFEVREYASEASPPEVEVEFRRIAATIQPGDIDAIVHVPGHFITYQETLETELVANRLGIPHAISVEDFPYGGHFAYSPDPHAFGEQASRLADKIFMGIPPSDIPIEPVAKSVLLLHLTRARDAGLSFSDSMLFIATEKRE
jgi:putative tryptophan/tyrosine transport system substrate-binding protein